MCVNYLGYLGISQIIVSYVVFLNKTLQRRRTDMYNYIVVSNVVDQPLRVESVWQSKDKGKTERLSDICRAALINA